MDLDYRRIFDLQFSDFRPVYQHRSLAWWDLFQIWPFSFFGSPTTSIYTPWTDEEAEAYLTTGWGEGAITEFNLEYLYGPEPKVSGE